MTQTAGRKRRWGRAPKTALVLSPPPLQPTGGGLAFFIMLLPAAQFLELAANPFANLAHSLAGSHHNVLAQSVGALA